MLKECWPGLVQLHERLSFSIVTVAVYSGDLQSLYEIRFDSFVAEVDICLKSKVNKTDLLILFYRDTPRAVLSRHQDVTGS